MCLEECKEDFLRPRILLHVDLDTRETGMN